MKIVGHAELILSVQHRRSKVDQDFDYLRIHYWLAGFLDLLFVSIVLQLFRASTNMSCILARSKVQTCPKWSKTQKGLKCHFLIEEVDETMHTAGRPCAIFYSAWNSLKSTWRNRSFFCGSMTLQNNKEFPSNPELSDLDSGLNFREFWHPSCKNCRIVNFYAELVGCTEFFSWALRNLTTKKFF